MGFTEYHLITSGQNKKIKNKYAYITTQSLYV